MQSTAAKAKKVSAFAYRNLKGCPPAVQTLLLRPCASSAVLYICVVGPPSATLEVHIGDGAVPVSLPHPS